MPETTASGHTLLGQNWDWLAGVYGRCAILRIRRSDRPSLICYTEAGIVGGKMGVNEHGIGLVEHGLVSGHDGRHKPEEHTSEHQSLMRITFTDFRFKKQKL